MSILKKQAVQVRRGFDVRACHTAHLDNGDNGINKQNC